MKKASIFLVGIDFFLAVVVSILTKHYYAWANLFIVSMMMFVIVKSKDPSSKLINVVWCIMFTSYNTVAIVAYIHSKVIIFDKTASFFLQYVLFAIIGLVIKFAYKKFYKNT